jgi:hypothetical protein
MGILGALFGGGGAAPPTHVKGKPISYATQEWRESDDEYQRIQRAKGGQAGMFMGSARGREAARQFNKGNRGWSLSNVNVFTTTAGFGNQGTTPKGEGKGGLGWTPQGAIEALKFSMEKNHARAIGQRQTSQSNYLFGGPSQSMYEKYSRWGDAGPQGNQGWRGTLTQAAAPQSTIRARQSHNNEVIQTRETRRKSDIAPFMTLQQHSNTPRLNPNLSYMYGQKSTEVGAVRRTVTRRL